MRRASRVAHFRELRVGQEPRAAPEIQTENQRDQQIANDGGPIGNSESQSGGSFPYKCLPEQCAVLYSTFPALSLPPSRALGNVHQRGGSPRGSPGASFLWGAGMLRPGWQ